MRPELVQIDAFTDRPFSGNPAAVCLIDGQPEDDWMQALATEMNLSETAFLLPLSIEPGIEAWRLRWFTPEVEVELCGHGTLAAAHYLFKHRAAAGPLLRFITLSGELTATRSSDGWIELDFPSDPPEEAKAPKGLVEALRAGKGVVTSAHGRNYHLLELASADAVRALEPDFGALEQVDVRAVIVTAVGDGLYDTVSRVFGPRVGINEDPVTGSAHCLLGPFWSARLGKDDLLAHQASKRGGVMRVGVRGERVLLSGQAVTTCKIRLDDAALPRRPKVPRRRSAAVTG